ncbi:5-hydroxyisourate hydrolase [Metarhizium anisopliae]|nr:5-hydroxyisourate hydrolase [Metarhizium anisopliae]
MPIHQNGRKSVLACGSGHPALDRDAHDGRLHRPRCHRPGSPRSRCRDRSRGRARGEAKDSITCHILDTTAGRPAKGVRVSLQGPNNSTFQSTTGDDGRVNTWESAGEGGQKLDEILAASQGSQQWTLNFKTGEYFKDTTAFFPEATVAFVVDQGERYHVPLLLTPFSYTTYRGS